MSDGEVDRVVRALERTAERVVTKITLDAVANLKAAPDEGGTPIDTGWASSNWVPRIGKDRDEPVGLPGNVSSAEQAQGEAEMLTYKLPMGVVYISNNVPYIGRLNLGSSPQAPAGFVERAIEKAVKVDLKKVSG